jgi:p-aminobenzoyl-glutamate transporter AbgT
MIKSIPIELPRELPRAARSSERVYFPWTLFFALFAVRILVIGGIVVVRHWDFSKIALLENTVDLITAGLVFYDASRKHISKALRWALGTLFLWVVFFPWYLARRRELQKACPLVEAEASPLMRGLVFLLFLYFILGALIVIMQKVPR